MLAFPLQGAHVLSHPSLPLLPALHTCMQILSMHAASCMHDYCWCIPAFSTTHTAMAGKPEIMTLNYHHDCSCMPSLRDMFEHTAYSGSSCARLKLVRPGGSEAMRTSPHDIPYHVPNMLPPPLHPPAPTHTPIHLLMSFSGCVEHDVE